MSAAIPKRRDAATTPDLAPAGAGGATNRQSSDRTKSPAPPMAASRTPRRSSGR